EKKKKIIDLRKYKDIADVSDNFNKGKFFETGAMVNQEILTSEINPIEEDLYPLSKILLESNYYNSADLSDYVVEDENLEKWKYLKGSKKIKRVNKRSEEYYYSERSEERRVGKECRSRRARCH